MKRPNRINIYLQEPLTEDNYHELWLNGSLFCIVWGKPTVQKRENDFHVSFYNGKLNFYVTDVRYHKEKVKSEAAK